MYLLCICLYLANKVLTTTTTTTMRMYILLRKDLQIQSWPPNLTTTWRNLDAVPTLLRSIWSYKSPPQSAYPRRCEVFLGDLQRSPNFPKQRKIPVIEHNNSKSYINHVFS